MQRQTSDTPNDLGVFNVDSEMKLRCLLDPRNGSFYEDSELEKSSVADLLERHRYVTQQEIEDKVVSVLRDTFSYFADWHKKEALRLADNILRNSTHLEELKAF